MTKLDKIMEEKGTELKKQNLRLPLYIRMYNAYANATSEEYRKTQAKKLIFALDAGIRDDSIFACCPEMEKFLATLLMDAVIGYEISEGKVKADTPENTENNWKEIREILVLSTLDV